MHQFNRLLITGDTHGEQNRMLFLVNKLEEGDVLFVAGDFGYSFLLDYYEKAFLNDMEKYLEERNCYIVYVDGNHENHKALNELPVSEWCGAKVHKLRKRVIHVLRGEILTLKNKSVFCFGGAFSIDRAFRRLNYSYWKEELPTDIDYANGNHNLEKQDYKVDYIITHTCPAASVYSLNGRHSAPEEMPLQNYLEWVRETVDYSHWWFGHWHQDKDLWKHQTAIYFDLINMETGERI
jgi:predicted phosphodiesterase